MKKLSFMVCPHDTAMNPERWFLFSQYLSKASNTSIRFSPSMDFQDFHENLANSDLVYANPQDSLRLFLEHQYQPFARSENLFDEVVLIANKEIENHSLQAINGSTVASVATLLPTCLALYWLKKSGIAPTSLFHRDSWLSVINSVKKGESPYGFVYKDLFTSLNRLSQSTVQVIDMTNEKSTFHMFMSHPKSQPLFTDIAGVLFKMHETSIGNTILKQLGMTRIIPTDNSALSFIIEAKKHCESVQIARTPSK